MSARGTALPELRRLAAIETDDCVPWTMGQTADGYGAIRYRNRPDRTHIVVCEWTHGPKPEGLYACHSCGNAICVNPRHLRWGTPQANVDDAIDHGTFIRGERVGGAKLTRDDVLAIRSRRASGENLRSLADEFGVTIATICDIDKRRSWSWV